MRQMLKAQAAAFSYMLFAPIIVFFVATIAVVTAAVVVTSAVLGPVLAALRPGEWSEAAGSAQKRMAGKLRLVTSEPAQPVDGDQ